MNVIAITDEHGMTPSRTPHRQSGYILPFVLLFMVAIMAGAASFFNRANELTKISGATRDYDQTMLLAEGGANWVLGRLINDSAATYALGCAANAMVGDLSCNGVLDASEAKPSSFSPTLPLSLGYQYYLVDGVTTTFSTTGRPGILQMIADGEARNTTASTLSNQTVLSTTGRIRINDLFVSASIHPILLVQSSTGLTRSTVTWANESAPEKVAVWLEITRNPDATKSGWFDVYVCAASQVGNAKGYVHRFIGSYTDLLGGGVIAPLSEAANHG